MRQTLLSRWQAALLGSSLGGIFGTQQAATLNAWREMHEQGVKALAETGDWQPVFSSQKATPAEILVQCLPLMLFFHDCPQTLQERLSAIAQEQKYSPKTTAAMVAYGKVIGWALRDELQEKTLFQDLQTTPSQTTGYEVLQTLQTQREKGETLKATKIKLPSPCQDIWLALYCFGITSEHLTVSVGRVQAIKGSNPLVLPLVGALTGGYNGVSGISLPWRLLLQKQQWEPRLAAMLGTWSGSYEFARIDQHLQKPIITDRVRGSAIASPGAIQGR